MPAAKNTARTAAPADLSILVMVVWTGGESAPRITECLSAKDSCEYARMIMDNNTAKRANEDAARATLIAAGLTETAELVERTPAIKVQIKRLWGERAFAVSRAMNAVEIAHEDDETSPERKAAAEAALVAAYLAP